MVRRGAPYGGLLGCALRANPTYEVGMGELFGIPVVFLSAINGRPTRVFCFASVGKPANPTPTLRRFPRKCVRIFVGARPQREGTERREIGQWLVNGLRVWWAFPVVGGGASLTLRVYMGIGGCIAGATPSPALPRCGLRPAGEGVVRWSFGISVVFCCWA